MIQNTTSVIVCVDGESETIITNSNTIKVKALTILLGFIDVKPESVQNFIDFFERRQINLLDELENNFTDTDSLLKKLIELQQDYTHALYLTRDINGAKAYMYLPQINIPYLKPDILTENMLEIIGLGINNTITMTVIPVEEYNGGNQKYRQAFICKGIQDLFKVEFQHLLLNDIYVKKCSNCGRYFVLTWREDGEYCDRIVTKSGLTCKQTGPKKKYGQKVKDNNITRSFTNSYKTRHAKYMAGKISKKEFESWRNEAVAQKNAAKERKISEEDFLSWLKNS